VIAFAVRRLVIDGSDEGAGFFRLQITSGPASCSLVANGENAAVLPGSRHILPQKMLHKTVNGGEAAIPRDRTVSAA